jgi:CheY-like chemotaxis protein
MGVDAFKIGSVLRGVLAQRLVRRLCPKCAEALSPEEVPEDVRPPAGYEGTYAPKSAVGCRACSGTGYHGRLAVMELLPVEGDVPKLIESGAAPQAILNAAKPHGLRTLWESGLIRFWNGVTSFQEIRRVLGEMQHHGGADAGPAGAVAPASGREEGALPARGPDERLTVLLADDDAQMRRLVKSVLERDGFRVLEAGDGLDALDVVSQHHLDLVILDQDMPRLTGLGVLEELRAQFGTAGTPIIMLTARTDDTESQAFELGAQDYLTKPFQPRSLLARVRAVLKRTSMS